MPEEEKARFHDERLAIFYFGRHIESIMREDKKVKDIELDFKPPNEYPDAILYLEYKNGEKYRLNIEFEGASNNFEQHGHDPEKCDLIVCTLHDWTNAPVPVLDAVLGKIFKAGKGIKGSFYEQLEKLKKKET